MLTQRQRNGAFGLCQKILSPLKRPPGAVPGIILYQGYKEKYSGNQKYKYEHPVLYFKPKSYTLKIWLRPINGVLSLFDTNLPRG